MNVGHLNVSRPTWYDRVTNTIGSSDSQGATAPHGLTTRVTYTTPSSKRALVESCHVCFARGANPTTDAETRAQWAKTPAVGTTGALLRIQQWQNQSVGRNAQLTQPLSMLAGDAIDYANQDGCTGGTFIYSGGFSGVEFTI